MRFVSRQIVSLLLAFAVITIAMLDSDRVVGQVPSESALEVEELKLDKSTDDLDECQGSLSTAVIQTKAVAHPALIVSGCGRLPSSPLWRWSSRGPPNATRSLA